VGWGLRLGGNGGSPKPARGGGGDRSGRPIARGGPGVSVAGGEADMLRTAKLARTEGVRDGVGATPQASGVSPQSAGGVCAARGYRCFEDGNAAAGLRPGGRGTRSGQAVELGAGGGDGTIRGGSQRTARRQDGADGPALTHNRKGHMLAASQTSVKERRRADDVPRGVWYHDSLKRPSF